jgi:hypothetical protein
VEESIMTASRPMLVIVLVAWLLTVLVAGHGGMFEAAAGQPPLGLLIALAAPLFLFAVLYRTVTAFRRFVLGADLRFLTVVQAWRVLGVMFLALYAYDLLPGLFAWPAGVGDALVGFAAAFAVLAIVRGEPRWPRRVAWLNVAGLIDFAVAIATGVLTSNTALGWFAEPGARASLGSLPLSLVPTFAVPLWTIFHVISLLQLRKAKSQQQIFTFRTHVLDIARSSS